MSRPTRHHMIVTIECDVPMGARQAEQDFIHWATHAFERGEPYTFHVFSIGRIASKPMRALIEAAQQKDLFKHGKNKD